MDADIQKRIRAHLVAFAAILVLTFVAAGTVLAGVSNVYLVGGIAALQAAIILTAMMHARADGIWVRGVLFFAALFVVTLLGLTLLGQRSTIVGTEHIQPAAAVDVEAH